uniref:OB domain-containing protein n=1 Tax=Angiostrongylus cantonensis TaxID=6313 RepID=A0A0K0CXP7_ANGCA
MWMNGGCGGADRRPAKSSALIAVATRIRRRRKAVVPHFLQTYPNLVPMAANHAHSHLPQQQNEGYVKIASLLPQMNCINTYGIVLENHPPRRLANGSLVVSMRIADPSGSIIFTIMNAEVQDLFEPGDIIKIKNGFTNVHRGMLNLSCGRQGEFMKSGDFMLVYSETPNMSEFNSEYAAMERARKPSPPPDGEIQSNDLRRAQGVRPGMSMHKRPPPPAHQSVPPGAPPPKRQDQGGPVHFRGRL